MWGDEQEQRAAHPAPTVSSRDGVAGVYPPAVLKMAERAREAGWDVRQQYARGCSMHGSTGRPLAEADSYALIFFGHPLTDAGAYAVYRGGGWKSINIAGRALGSVTDLAQWLAAGGQVATDWFEAVAQRMRDAEQAKKAAPKKAAAGAKRRESGG